MTGSLTLTDVDAFIATRHQSLLDRLFDYLRRPSISAHGHGIDDVASYIAGVMRQIGLTTDILPTGGWPVVIGAWHGAPGRPTVLLYGHYDVQPPDPLDAWVTPPFEPALRDGRIYARGAGDNKGQHFANLLAIEALLATRGALPCNVTVLLEGEEEVGSPHMPEVVARYRDRLQADLVITSDGPVDESGRSRILFGVRGVLSFELRARGANRDLHSGNWGGVAPNPLWTLIHLLASMKNEQGEITIGGFYDRVLPLTADERRVLAVQPVDEAAIRAQLGLATFDAPPGRGYAERLAAWPTLTVNGLHGGYGGPGSKTVLPHEAVAKCDIRLVEAQTVDDIWARVVAHVQRHAPSVEAVLQCGMEPSKTPLNSPWAVPIQRAMVVAQGAEPLLVPALGGSLPDYVFTKTLGIPAFGVPYANADEGNHAPNENLEVDRFFGGIRTGAALLLALAEEA
ncbi:MAG: M20/M25/M40 family metallo-hydrolase [Chloroflexi bacterium]|nr:M20/M25/M40 family metallo-hydrolase [Chloroflexota bacterium]